MKQHFSQEEIANAPQWLAAEMETLNDVDYYLGSARQFINLSFAATFGGIIIVLATTRYWAAFACYALGFISNYVGGRYNRRADKLLKRSRL